MEKNSKYPQPDRQNCLHTPSNVQFLFKGITPWLTLINEHRLVCFLLSIKEYSLAPSEGGQNISSFSITSCWIFLKVPTAFPCCSDKMLCPTLLVYSLLFPPLPWSASGGLSACFTDVSSTPLLGCFSSGFLKQMFPCVHAPSFLLTPFLSMKTICCCLSDLERDHPIPQMLIFFLVSLALVHMVSRQYLPLFCSSWLTMLMFCSFNLIFLCYPYTHSFGFFSFSFFLFFFSLLLSAFFVLVAHMGSLHLSLQLGRGKPRTLTVLPWLPQATCMPTFSSAWELKKKVSFTFSLNSHRHEQN